MCGIVCLLNIKQSEKVLRSKVLTMVRTVRHRGPDWSGIYSSPNAILAHERLAIVDPVSGQQPLVSSDGSLVLAVNGEIYNHSQLRKGLNFDFKTASDCEIILALYQKYGVACVHRLSGMFAYVLYDKINDTFMVARDHMGIIPLYMGKDSKGQLYFASELKALVGYCENIQIFPPGHYLTSELDHPEEWYKPEWQFYENVENAITDTKKLKTAFENSVRSHMMTDVPYGLLLSGGLDSSLVSAIAKKYSAYRVEEKEKKVAWWPQIHSFAVGLKDSPDIKAAKQVAEHIGTVHHEVLFTIQEGIDALRDVIYHIETYDVTTVRASTPMYLLARVIKSMGIKMVLSGEGADEIFGGYLYFHKAPNPRAFHEETVRKLKKLHLYDCLRANKSLASWGVEARVPFLEKEFLDIAMTINPSDKMIDETKKEKWVLRKSLEEYLPKEILWRQKEQFSDGVGYSWINELKRVTEELIDEKQFSEASKRFPINTPQNKEEYFYREIFESHFPSESAIKTVPSVPSVACSTPEALLWDSSFQNTNDPSGRAVNSHESSYNSSHIPLD